MDLHVIAIADTGTYLAADASGTACLFALEVGNHIELGDVLRCGSQRAHSPVRIAQNLTQECPVSLRMQHWAASSLVAINFWLQSLIPRPGVIFVGSGRLLASDTDTPHRLQDHIPSARRDPRPHTARFESTTSAGLAPCAAPATSPGTGTIPNHASASHTPRRRGLHTASQPACQGHARGLAASPPG